MKKENSLAEALLGWYRANGRILPWRSEPSPYRVLVSEFMLQQTRVQTVIPYFERFMERFQDLASLAFAEEDEVLRLWQGLGYYSRARNLRKTAQKCVESHGNCIPSASEELRSLPGIGSYMEKAIRAFAFDMEAVPIDGNLMRVYTRLTASSFAPDDPHGKKEAEAFFLRHMASPRHFGQALMDLGELVCLPSGEPKCDECPFKGICLAHINGKETDYPLRKKKTNALVEKRSVLLLLDRQGRLSLRKRPDTGLLASVYEFPNVLGDKEELSAFTGCKDLRYLGHKVHVFSHVRWEMDVYMGVGEIDGFIRLAPSEIKEKAALPTAFAKLLSFLADGR